MARSIEVPGENPSPAASAGTQVSGALEKSGYTLAWIGRLDSDDPADDGSSAIYVRHRAK